MFGFEGIKGVLFKFKEEQEMEEQEMEEQEYG